MFKKTVLGLALACGMSLAIVPQVTMAKSSNDVAQVSFDNLLQQERAWAGLESKSVKVGEISWRYSEGGDASKPAILLVHGLSGSRDNWNRVAHYLTPYYHVIIPDLPYHGETQVPAEFDSSVPNMTEKLRRFAEAVHIEKGLNVAGHSLGGAIAMLYGAQYSTDTKSLMLMDAAGVYKAGNTKYLKDPSTLKDLVVNKPGDFDKLMGLATANPPFIPKEILAQQEKLMMSQAKNTQYVVDQLVAIQKAFTPESFAMMAKIIDFPVQILWGGQDKIINKEVAQELKGLLKEAKEAIIYQNVGHMPLLELDQVVARDYLQFLQSLK